MTLNEMISALDDLSAEELDQLFEQIEQRRKVLDPRRGITPEERIRRMNEAAAIIREGFTDEEWAEVEAAMNDEYIEPFDEDEWKD